MRDAGALPTFKGYPQWFSIFDLRLVNEQVVHGFPQTISLKEATSYRSTAAYAKRVCRRHRDNGPGRKRSENDRNLSA